MNPCIYTCLILIIYNAKFSQIVTSDITTTQSCNNEKEQIIFLVDSSSSVCESNDVDHPDCNWKTIKSFLKDVVSLLPMQTRWMQIGLFTFASKINTLGEPTLTTDQNMLLTMIDQLPFSGGNTNISGALRFARYVLNNSMSPSIASSSNDIKKVIVLITDGLSNVDSSLTLQEARLNKQLSIEQYAIGITKYTNEDELQDLVSDPVSYYYLNASDFSHLNLLINELLQRLTCSQPPLPEPCRDTRADLAILLDSSGSILIKSDDRNVKFSNWVLMKNFVISVVRNLNIKQTETRVALITFSHIARVEFYLKDFNNLDSMIANISKIDIIGSETNTSGALRLMNDKVFQDQNGDRPDIPNVAIVMTDGQSNVNYTGTIPEAMKARSLGVRIFVIGLTDEIYYKELQGIASSPLETHLFNRTSYSLVETVVSNLVWNVCHNTCADNDGSFCSAGSLKRCAANEQLKWTMYPGSLIIGHDYARLTDILTADSCKTICLQDPLCRSIEFIPLYQECSVSYYRKADVMQSFRKDPEVNYYEWICTA